MKFKTLFYHFFSLILFVSTPLLADENFVNRLEVQAFIKEMASKNSFNADELNRVFSQVNFQPSVIKAMLPPSSPTVRSWTRYRSRFVNAQRVAKGHVFMAKYVDTLKRAEVTYQVPAEIIAGIIGVETVFGENKGSYRVIDALTTLAFDYPKRAEYFKTELEAFLLLCREQQVDVFLMKGSYAGAIGWPQFMPSNIRKLAVDFDNDGAIDVLNNPIDAIGSVARYFQFFGWQKDAPIAIPIDAAEPIPSQYLQDITPLLTYADTATLKFLPHNTEFQPLLDAGTTFAFIPLETPDAATEYWLGFKNFYVITRYNKSSFYAMSVMQLAQAIKTDLNQ